VATVASGALKLARKATNAIRALKLARMGTRVQGAPRHLSDGAGRVERSRPQ